LLDGLKVLVVEDCRLMAELIGDVLVEAGAVVVGTTASVDASLDFLAGHSVDVVCLDVKLGREDSLALADTQATHAIPFVFVTVSGREEFPRRHRDQPFVSKMEMTDELVPACFAASLGDPLRDTRRGS
jgi:chemotaxis response regulator CheB